MTPAGCSIALWAAPLLLALSGCTARSHTNLPGPGDATRDDVGHGDSSPGDSSPGDPDPGDLGPGDSTWMQPGIGPFLVSSTLGTELTLTSDDWVEVTFDPAVGGVIDTWYDLGLDPGRTTNLATDQAFNDYDGLFFQRTDIAGTWRPQGADNAATVEPLLGNAVHAIVYVEAQLTDPTATFIASQRYVALPMGIFWIEATYTALAAATPNELNYGLGVANNGLTGLNWTHATSDAEPLPLRVVQPAPEFIFHHASAAGNSVFAGLFPVQPMPVGAEVFGVYDLTNVEYIYYIDNDRPFAVGESSTRNLVLVLSGGTTTAAELQPYLDDIEIPPTLSILRGDSWPNAVNTFEPSEAASRVVADSAGVSMRFGINERVRHVPMFRIGGWPSTEVPGHVSLEGVLQTNSRDYDVDFEPVSRAWYFPLGTGSPATQLAHGGYYGQTPAEELADSSSVSSLAFDDPLSGLLIGFASPVTGFHVQVDSRVSVADGVLAWDYYATTGWRPLTVDPVPGAAANLTTTGWVRFEPAADWALRSGPTGEVPLYYIRATPQVAVPFNPPLPIRSLFSDVVDLQLHRHIDRDVVIDVTP